MVFKIHSKPAADRTFPFYFRFDVEKYACSYQNWFFHAAELRETIDKPYPFRDCSSMAKVNCPKCGIEYSKGGLWSRYDEELCPDCHFDGIEKEAGINQFGNSDVSESTPIHGFIRDTNLNSDLSKLIQAQDRTTHAIRSIAIICVATPLVYFGVFTLWTLSTVNQSLAGQIVSGVVGLAATAYLLVLSITELSQSRVK